MAMPFLIRASGGSYDTENTWRMRSISTTREVLTRTSRVLDGWLRGLPDVGTRAQDGSDTWSAYDVVGHLVHGEKTDWVPRARIILEHGDTRPFEPFERFAQLRRQNESIDQRLDDFAALRRASLTALDEMALTPTDLERRGRHPELDAVTLGELLAAWTTSFRFRRSWRDAIEMTSASGASILV